MSLLLKWAEPEGINQRIRGFSPVGPLLRDFAGCFRRTPKPTGKPVLTVFSCGAAQQLEASPRPPSAAKHGIRCHRHCAGAKFN